MARVSVKGLAKKAQKEDEKLRQTAKSLVSNSFMPESMKKSIRDSFQNFAANLGIGTNNITSWDTYGFNPITRVHTLLEWIHRGTWLGGVAIDIVADDMTRAGISLKGELDPADTEQIQEEAVLTGVWQAINECIKLSRLYGGAIGVLLIDGQDVSTEFRLDTVGPGMFKGILPLDRWMVEPDLTNLVRDMGPNLGLPNRYRVSAMAPAFVNKWIHYSRCIRLDGIRLPYWQRLVENLWGESELERFYDRLKGFDAATTGATQLVHKLYLRTYKLKDFREVVAAGGDQLAALSKYVDMMRQFQTLEGMTLLDLEDEFDASSGSPAVTGIDQLLTHFGQQIAGALQIPLVRLFGMSPAGFNATGESDMRNYYDGIKQRQEQTLRVPVSIVYRCIAQSLGIELPDGFSIGFNSLWQMSDKEKAEIAVSVTQAIRDAGEAGYISQQTAMEELRQSSEVTGIFSNITKEQIESAETELPPGMPEGEVEALIRQTGQVESAEARAAGPAQPKGPGDSAADSVVRVPAEQAGYVELPGAVKDGDCQVVAVVGGVSLKKGCCNNFQLGAGAQRLFSCGTCKFHEDKVRVGQDAAHDSPSAMAWYHDVPVAIENPKGTERRGRGWSINMPSDYGYIRRVTGADGREMDCFVGPAPESKNVFVINSKKPHNDSFDEHKVMFGYHTQDSALEDFQLAYHDRAKDRIMDIYDVTMDVFKEWLKTGDHDRPFRPNVGRRIQ